MDTPNDTTPLRQASRISFASALLMLAYTNFRSAAPPNRELESKGERPARDDIGRAAGGKSVLFLIRHAHSLLAAWNAGLVLFPPPSFLARGWFHQNDPSLKVMDWNFMSATTVIAGIIGGIIRIAAYGGLGKDFTFTLRTPNKLTTSGIYKYVQHPSYTGLFLIVISQSIFLYRVDGPLATVLPPEIQKRFAFVNRMYRWVILVGGSFIILRMKQEEEMLKKAFGKEWIDWNRRTARLIPYVL